MRLAIFNRLSFFSFFLSTICFVMRATVPRLLANCSLPLSIPRIFIPVLQSTKLFLPLCAIVRDKGVRSNIFVRKRKWRWKTDIFRNSSSLYRKELVWKIISREGGLRRGLPPPEKFRNLRPFENLRSDYRRNVVFSARFFSKRCFAAGILRRMQINLHNRRERSPAVIDRLCNDDDDCLNGDFSTRRCSR